MAETDLSRASSMWLAGISGKGDFMTGLAKMAVGMMGGIGNYTAAGNAAGQSSGGGIT